MTDTGSIPAPNRPYRRTGAALWNISVNNLELTNTVILHGLYNIVSQLIDVNSVMLQSCICKSFDSFVLLRLQKQSRGAEKMSRDRGTH